MQKPKVIVIVGPTATGKSDLAVHLAKKFNGEIVSADSRQVYKGLDLGTGKITEREMRGVPHYLLDVANPKKIFTAADFVRYGRENIRYIVRNGKVPILAGGTGFYIAALLGEILLPEVPPNKKLRAQLEGETTENLLLKLKKFDADRALAIDTSNKQRILRAIEIAKAFGRVPPRKRKKLFDALKIGIDLPDQELKARISKRLYARLRRGMLAEAKHLHDPPAAGGLSWKRMEALGLEYRYMALYLQKKITKEEMTEQIETKIWQYAKRQRTWFKKDKAISWFRPAEIKKIEKMAERFLA